ncbi:MAG: hypothetical protein HQL44_08810 [Alphaproteobacteria bacterium]|nr:hypothetical protein [Alphaproteobacteria bacterium]
MAAGVSIRLEEAMDGDEDQEARIRIPRAMLPQAVQQALGISLQEASELLFEEFGERGFRSSIDEEEAELSDRRVLRREPDYPNLSACLPFEGLTIREFKNWIEFVKAVTACAAPGKINSPAALPINPKRAPAPTIHNWDLIWEEAIMMAAEGKIPETQGAFFGALRHRIEAKNASVPDDETLRRKFRNLHAQLRERALTAPKGQKA